MEATSVTLGHRVSFHHGKRKLSGIVYDIGERMTCVVWWYVDTLFAAIGFVLVLVLDSLASKTVGVVGERQTVLHARLVSLAACANGRIEDEFE